MKVDGQHYQTIWLKAGDERVVQIIDQRFLPHRFVIEDVTTVAQMATAIREMHVRGAGLIGAAVVHQREGEVAARHCVQVRSERRQWNVLQCDRPLQPNNRPKESNDHERAMSFRKAKVGNPKIPIHPNEAGPDRREKRQTTQR